MRSSEPPQSTPDPRPRRRWFQYSLRTLLVLMTACAVLFAWWSHSARQQRNAVAAIEKAGGGVWYELEFPNLKQPHYGTAWLVNVLGKDYFSTIHWISFLDTHVTDATLEHLHDVTGLQELNLTGTNISDDGLKHLKGLISLSGLALCDTQITDAGLKHLRNLNNLKILDLRSTRVTDAGVAQLQQALPNCEISH